MVPQGFGTKIGPKLKKNITTLISVQNYLRMEIFAKKFFWIPGHLMVPQGFGTKIGSKLKNIITTLISVQNYVRMEIFAKIFFFGTRGSNFRVFDRRL